LGGGGRGRGEESVVFPPNDYDSVACAADEISRATACFGGGAARELLDNVFSISLCRYCLLVARTIRQLRRL